MTAEQHWDFARTETFTSWWTDAIERFLSVQQAGFVIEPVGPANTSIRVPAGTGVDMTALAIRGKWRWVEATITKAVSGGAGVKDIYAVTAANLVDSTPVPFSDHTNYAFDVQVLASGVTPTIVAGTVDHFRKVGEATWDGAKITRLKQLVGRGPLVRDEGWTLPTGYTPRRTLAASYTMDQLRDFVGSMAEVLVANGILNP